MSNPIKLISSLNSIKYFPNFDQINIALLGIIDNPHSALQKTFCPTEQVKKKKRATSVDFTHDETPSHRFACNQIMAAPASLGDKIFKVVAASCAAITVIGLTGLGANVYLNTGKYRKPLPVPAESATESDTSASPSSETSEQT